MIIKICSTLYILIKKTQLYNKYKAFNVVKMQQF